MTSMYRCHKPWLANRKAMPETSAAEAQSTESAAHHQSHRENRKWMNEFRQMEYQSPNKWWHNWQ